MVINPFLVMFKGEHYLKPCISWSSHLHSLTFVCLPSPTDVTGPRPRRNGGSSSNWLKSSRSFSLGGGENGHLK